MLCIAVGIFGYLTPYYFLTTYTQLKVSSLEPQSIEAALPLVMANFASESLPNVLRCISRVIEFVFCFPGGFGRIFAGLLADKIGPVNTLFTSFFIGVSISIKSSHKGYNWSQYFQGFTSAGILAARYDLRFNNGFWNLLYVKFTYPPILDSYIIDSQTDSREVGSCRSSFRPKVSGYYWAFFRR